MKYFNTLSMAAASGAGAMTGFFVVLVVADWIGALDVLLDVLTGTVQAICQ